MKNHIFSNFKQSQGRTYFRASLGSPYENVAPEMAEALRGVISWRRRRILQIVCAFAALLVVAVLFYPFALMLKAGWGLIVAGTLMSLAVAPFVLVLFVHFVSQKRIRLILVANRNRAKTMPSPRGKKSLRSLLSHRVLVLLFLISVSGASLSGLMLLMQPDQLTNPAIIGWGLIFCGAISTVFVTGRLVYTRERQREGEVAREK